MKSTGSRRKEELEDNLKAQGNVLKGWVRSGTSASPAFLFAVKGSVTKSWSERSAEIQAWVTDTLAEWLSNVPGKTNWYASFPLSSQLQECFIGLLYFCIFQMAMLKTSIYRLTWRVLEQKFWLLWGSFLRLNFTFRHVSSFKLVSFTASKNSTVFFFFNYIFWEEKECLSFANLHCNKPSSRGIINLFSICGQNSSVDGGVFYYFFLLCTAENIWLVWGHANPALTELSGKVDL